MQNYNKQKSNQTNLVNFNSIHENLPTNNANRAFGKDITNQVKYFEGVEKTKGNNHDKNIAIQNNLISIKTTYRVQRGKIQSMDDNLLKNFLNKNATKQNQNFFKENHEVKNEKIELNVNNNTHVQNINPHQRVISKPKKEEINLIDNNYEALCKINRFKNLHVINCNSVLEPTNQKPIKIEKREVSLFNRNSQLEVHNKLNLAKNNYFDHSLKNPLINLSTSTYNLKNANLTGHQLFFKKEEEIHPISSDVIMKMNTSSEEEEVIQIIDHNQISKIYAQPHEEYLDDIYINILQEELYDSTCDYMPFQDHINPRMRIILVEWIVDVTFKFKLRQNTMFLTIHLIDRFLSLRKITRSKYQLLGACCILIACKFEEIYFPELRDIIYICDKTYSGDEIIAMESEILKGLDYKIVPVSPSRFLQIIAAQLNLSEFDYNLCNLMLELVIFDYEMVKVLPSLIACTCVYITYKIKKMSTEECNSLLDKYYSTFFFEKFPEAQIKECAQVICALLDKINLSYFKKIKEKYSKKEFCEVANFYYL